MKTLYQYAIIRFLPHAQTGEFANVGIVVCAPEQAVFEFRLAPARFARVTDFFDDVEGKLYTTTIATVKNELDRLKEFTTNQFGQDLVTVMNELVRPRETLVRYSELRTMYIDKKPAEVADQLFAQLVHRTFLTEAYQEQLMVRAIKTQLKAEKLTHFRRLALAGRFDEITFPLVAKTNDTFVIRPLAFQQKNITNMMDHAQTWLGRFARLAQNDALKNENILLPLQGPTANTSKLIGAFGEVKREFDKIGVQVVGHNDTRAISAFAKEALLTDGFTLTH